MTIIKYDIIKISRIKNQINNLQILICIDLNRFIFNFYNFNVK